MVRLSRRQHLFAIQKCPVGDDRYPNHDRLFIRKSHHTKKEWSQNQWSKVQLVRNTKVGKKNKENAVLAILVKPFIWSYIWAHVGQNCLQPWFWKVETEWDSLFLIYCCDLLHWFLYIYTLILDSMPATRFKQSRGRCNKRLGKFRKAAKTPVWILHR